MRILPLLLLWLPPPALADGPELSACDRIDPVADARTACADYDKHPGFAHVKTVQEARRACLAYYQAAWEANVFFCSFTRHVLQTRAEAASLAAGSAPRASLAAKDRAFFAETLKGLAHHHGRITKTAHELKYRLGRVNNDGMDTSVAEMNCTFNRNRTPPGAVAGPMLIGLAEKGNAEVFLNEPELIASLRATSKVIRAAEKAELPSAAAELLADPKAPSRKEGAIQPPEAPEDPTPDSTHTFWALNSIAQYYAEHYGDEYLAAWAKRLLRSNPKAFKRVPFLVKKFPEYAGTIAAGALGVGLQYLAHGKVGALELISVGVTAYSFGAGLIVDLAIAAYRDTQDRKREYAEFAHGELGKRPFMSSGALATLWAKEKKTTCWFREDKWAYLEATAKKEEAPAKDGGSGNAPAAAGEDSDDEEDED